MIRWWTGLKRMVRFTRPAGRFPALRCSDHHCGLGIRDLTARRSRCIPAYVALQPNLTQANSPLGRGVTGPLPPVPSIQIIQPLQEPAMFRDIRQGRDASTARRALACHRTGQNQAIDMKPGWRATGGAKHGVKFAIQQFRQIVGDLQLHGFLDRCGLPKLAHRRGRHSRDLRRNAQTKRPPL